MPTPRPNEGRNRTEAMTDANLLHNPKCFANHMGIWACDTTWLNQAVSQIRSGASHIYAKHAEIPDIPDSGFFLRDDGIAVIPIVGPTMKGDSKFGGTSTIRVRNALRQGMRSRDVKAGFLHMDTPGGHVAGQVDLADDIERFAAVKPIFAHADDMVTSAGLWTAVMATKFFASRATEVGSIGVFGRVEDTSGAAEMAGVKVHVISSGDKKGQIQEGAPITEEALETLQERVDEMADLFTRAVASGRKMDIRAVRKIADGQTFLAPKAQELGLIDGVQTFDATLAALQKEINQGRTRSKRAERKLRLAQLGG